MFSNVRTEEARTNHFIGALEEFQIARDGVGREVRDAVADPQLTEPIPW